jgi:2-C-methyl-D-erythritol 4-phosphate cytidylyltransferase
MEAERVDEVFMGAIKAEKKMAAKEEQIETIHDTVRPLLSRKFTFDQKLRLNHFTPFQ